MLRDNAAEIQELYSDLLIRVTGFFRDPEVFEAVKSEVLPNIMPGRGSGDPVRIWVPGCATGEEVYSLAIAVLEYCHSTETAPAVHIFGTDVSDAAVDSARLGVYPENIAAEMSPDRLRRFFTRVNGQYRVNKVVRDCCIFARQNLTKDPPFSRLDMVSCRNVMIYLGTMLQRKVMTIFHYALRPEWIPAPRQLRDDRRVHRPVRSDGPQAQDLREEGRRRGDAEGRREFTQRRQYHGRST